MFYDCASDHLRIDMCVCIMHIFFIETKSDMRGFANVSENVGKSVVLNDVQYKLIYISESQGQQSALWEDANGLRILV